MSLNRRLIPAFIVVLLAITFTPATLNSANAAPSSEWDGWAYLGDDGNDPRVPTPIDILEHGYKVEDDKWYFKSLYGTPLIQRNLPDEPFPLKYIYAVDIDSRPGGTNLGDYPSGFKPDYKLVTVVTRIPSDPYYDGLEDALDDYSSHGSFGEFMKEFHEDIVEEEESSSGYHVLDFLIEFQEDGTPVYRGPLPYSEISDSKVISSVRLDSLDLGHENVRYRWETWRWQKSPVLFHDTTQVYSISSGEVPMSTFGMALIPIIMLPVFLVAYFWTRKKY